MLLFLSTIRYLLYFKIIIFNKYYIFETQHVKIILHFTSTDDLLDSIVLID
jgi:hypothetical protein